MNTSKPELETKTRRVLYGYWRSSASYRVRLALNIKGLNYEHRGVHLVKSEQNSDDFLAINSQGLVPVYVEGQGKTQFSLPQSLAIIDYLDEKYPNIALLPSCPQRKSLIRAATQTIACEIHPLDNLRVLQYLKQTLNVTEDEKVTWYRHWIETGFKSLEKQLTQLLDGQRFSMVDRPGYLESVIIPQIYNAKRFNCSLDSYPNIVALDKACASIKAFEAALPENQPDAQ